MKIAITGHTSGIGKYLFNELSKEHDVIGYSRTNMFDISDSEDVILLILICLFKKIAEILFNKPTLSSVYIEIVYLFNSILF